MRCSQQCSPHRSSVGYNADLNEQRGYPPLLAVATITAEPAERFLVTNLICLGRVEEIERNFCQDQRRTKAFTPCQEVIEPVHQIRELAEDVAHLQRDRKDRVWNHCISFQEAFRTLTSAQKHKMGSRRHKQAPPEHDLSKQAASDPSFPDDGHIFLELRKVVVAYSGNQKQSTLKNVQPGLHMQPGSQVRPRGKNTYSNLAPLYKRCIGRQSPPGIPCKHLWRHAYQAVELGAADDLLAEQVEALEEVLVGVLVPQPRLHLLKEHQLLLEVGVCTRESGMFR